ncbi:elongation factor P hydroxylase [Edwardsiella tarda]|uniref:elongation factor P hydroxylase n=1 Tax=Edwardsiella tarda TaxID=636 RepID=UPI00351C426F
MSVTHHYQQLIDLFAQTFGQEYQTRLVAGEEEPIYLPADETDAQHRIIFAHGYYASALHEISHWCIAGEARRRLEDYGYWYCPDGRDAATQAQFEVVEVKPQALDWLFCVVAGYPFNVSCDNLEGNFDPDRIAFQRRVREQVLVYLAQGIPPRAARFVQALQSFYNTPALSPDAFPYPEALQ